MTVIATRTRHLYNNAENDNVSQSTIWYIVPGWGLYVTNSVHQFVNYNISIASVKIL